MIDIENAVFDTVATAFDAAYPNGSRYSEDNSAPARFPCLTLVEMDNYTYERSLDASLMEHDAWLSYEVNVYCDKGTGQAKMESKKIMDLVDETMQNLGFVRISCGPVRNADSQIYRMTARYRCVISEDYRVYRN